MKNKHAIVIVTILFLIGFASFAGANQIRDEPSKNPFIRIWAAINYLQEQIDEILETSCDCNNVSFKHVITEDDIYYEYCSFTTVKISDSRIVKDCSVSVYMVDDTQNTAFTSINASYDIVTENGALFLDTAWNNAGFDNPPVGEKLLIFVTYYGGVDR